MDSFEPRLHGKPLRKVYSFLISHHSFLIMKTMRPAVRFLLALVVALLLMLCFRTLAFTICTVEGDGLSPALHRGDRVLVNRWSYGLRVGGGEGLFSYGRIGRRPLNRGDLVAFENPQDISQVLICRCKGVPGDTIRQADGTTTVVPGLVNCAAADHYWLEALSPGNPTDSRLLGFIAEQFIIGRVTTVVFSHDTTEPLWRGWDGRRLLLAL